MEVAGAGPGAGLRDGHAGDDEVEASAHSTYIRIVIITIRLAIITIITIITIIATITIMI